MQIHFLGTSSGSPSLSRNMSATGVSFEKSKSWLLVDCGEATQHQLLKAELSPYHLSVICISHLHGDHCYGLPGLLASMAMSGRTDPVYLIAPQAVVQFVMSTLALTQVTLPFDLHTMAIEQSDQFISLGFCYIEIIPLKHRVPSFGFKITEALIPRKLRIKQLQNEGIATGPHYNLLQKGQDVIYQGQRLAADTYAFPSWRPRSVIVCGDNEKPSLLSSYCDDIDMLVHEATFTHPDLMRVGTHTGHSDAKRVAQFAQQYQIPALILTHFSVRYHGEGMLDVLENEARTHFHGNLRLAYDFLVLTVPKQLLSE
ncbi:ribonuclease Z [Pseudoalteromonas sp. DL2-H2.2]|uniref:ribonuclease Z n=1 Tax=Pseudoalteromonas sp. DL2-H2.2 TaxID=2908889 RepID=UPI001F200842|nr:ribonuclease Z [Pseudoalteromonas sp. DL2-H2.2]MCF2906827.1 ribonuclease Z [Pseudoalteromonas sp. DL2-H2.2]